MRPLCSAGASGGRRSGTHAFFRTLGSVLLLGRVRRPAQVCRIPKRVKSALSKRTLCGQQPGLLGQLAALIVWLLPAPTACAQAVLAPLPPGSTLPVLLEHTLDARHLRAGQATEARLSQRVPLGGGRYLPQGTELLGIVDVVDPSQLSIRWTMLRLHHRSEPVIVKLVAAADSFDVSATKDPLGGPTRSTSDWVVEQIGGDEIYGVNVATTVYNRYSEPVGHADADGVYEPPGREGLPDRALGPFSTSSAGLYDLQAFTVVSAGPGAIVLGLHDPRWRLRAGSALLLEVAAP